MVDGRFKGGYITRHYCRPGEGVHTVQMEMALSCYMRDERPFVIYGDGQDSRDAAIPDELDEQT